MSGRFAIAQQFETPLLQPAVLKPAVLQPILLKASAQGDASAQTAGEASSEFAQLIHQITNESVLQAPAVTAVSRPIPVLTQPPAVVQGKSAPAPAKVVEIPTLHTALAVTVPTPAAILPPAPIEPKLPELTAQNGEAVIRQPRQLIKQTAGESVPQTEVPAQQKEAAQPNQPIAASGSAQRPQKPTPAKGAQDALQPAIAAAVPLPVPTPVKFRLPSFLAQPDEATQTAASVASGTPATAPAKREQIADPGPAAALELKIRMQDQPVPGLVDPAPQRAASASKPAQSGAQPADSALEAKPQAQPRAEQIIHAVASVAEGSMAQSAPVHPAQTSAVVTLANTLATTAATPQVPFTNTSSGAKTEQPVDPTAHLEEPLPDQPKQQAQPLRSISIEFTPDGAQDVRLRLAERAGDVHISLHSTDPVLAGRLSNGVHDLVGTLANAGYDAQAWTPGQGRQNQRSPEDPRRNRRTNLTETGAEEFGAVMQQPIKSNA